MLIVGLILILTIVATVGAGVMIGYWLLCALLHLMGHRPEPQEAPSLITSQAHSGD